MKLSIILALALLASAASALALPAFGECSNLTLYNESSNTSYSDQICNSYPNLGINLTLNASDAATKCYLNSTFGIHACAVGNDTLIINTTINNTIYQNITSCNLTNTTLWANSTLQVGNATISCLANSTVVYLNQTQNITSCPPASATYWANSTNTINNATVTCLANWTANVPANYCYENIFKNPMGYGEILRSDRCNITAISPPNQTTILNSPICPQGQYCQNPPVACPQCPAQDCSANLTAARNECQTQLAAPADCSQEVSQQAQSYQRETQAAQEKMQFALNASNTAETNANGWKKQMEQAQADKNFIWGVALVFAIVLVIVGGGLWGYSVYLGRKSRLAESYPKAMEQSHYDNLLGAGSAIIVKKKEGEVK